MRLRQEQQNQRRNKRKEAEALRQQGIEDYQDFINNELWTYMKEAKQRDKDWENRSKD
jgi:hypothetical protein